MGWELQPESVQVTWDKTNPTRHPAVQVTPEGTACFGEQWCRTCLPEYLTDYAWNPIAGDLAVDLSPLDPGWGCGTDWLPHRSPIIGWPAGPVLPLARTTSGLGDVYWEYQHYTDETWQTGLCAVLAKGGCALQGESPPQMKFYSMSVYFLDPKNGTCQVWAGIKSGNTPLGVYRLCCSNSAYLLGGGQDIPDWGGYYSRWFVPGVKGPQLYPVNQPDFCNCLTFEVTQ